MEWPYAVRNRQALRGSARLLVIALALWWVLTEGAGGWFEALIVGLGATAVGMRYGPQQMFAWRPLQLVGFVAWFLQASLRGGVDVSLRACKRRMPIEPCFIRRQTVLPPGQPRTLFVGALSLMPGTLAADLDGDELLVHLLTPAMADEVDVLEHRIGLLFRHDAQAGGAQA